MGWTVRKSKKIGPFRVTASKSGLSLSGGVKGARVSVNSKGEVRRTIGIPGSGVYHTKRIDSKAQAAAEKRELLAQERAAYDNLAAKIIADQPDEMKQIIFNAYLEDSAECLKVVLDQALASPQLAGTDRTKLRRAFKEYMDRWADAA